MILLGELRTDVKVKLVRFGRFHICFSFPIANGAGFLRRYADSVRLLFRYILFSAALAAAMGVGFFVFVLMTGNAMRDIVGELAAGRISWQLAGELLLLLIPYSISFALPLGALIGVLVVLGRLSARQELTAMRAAGLSLWHISAPVFLLALLGWAAAAIINNLYAPVAKERYKSMLEEVVREDPLRFIVEGVFIKDFPGYVFYVENKEGDRLKRFWVWELDDQHRVIRMLRAREGRITFEAEADALFLDLLDVAGELRSERHPDDPRSGHLAGATENIRFRLPLEAVLGAPPERTLDPTRLDIFALLERGERLRGHLAGEEEVAAEIRRAWQRELSTIQYGISRNFAMAFAIVALVFLGIPMGIRASRSETHANLGLALILAMAYYVMLILIDWQEGIPERRAHLLVWIPNMLYCTVGLLLMRGARRR